jgi:hypothetical protein
MIFFDIDETLIDQRRAEAEAARQILSRYGDRLNQPYSVDEFCRVRRRQEHGEIEVIGSLQELAWKLPSRIAV